VSDLAQLVLSWKPRQQASTASVSCQTVISGDFESCEPCDTSQQAPQQQKKRKQGQTISECLKLRETNSTPGHTNRTGSSAMHSDTATTQTTVVRTSPAVGLSSDSRVSSSPQSDGTSASCSTASLSTAAVCQSQKNTDSSGSITAAPSRLGSSESSATVSEGNQTTGVNICTTNATSADSVCSLVPSSTVITSCNHGLLTSHQCRPVPAAAVPTYRVTGRVGGGPGPALVDMDIGSSVLGSGLVYGTFVYHSGRLVLGQHQNSAVSVWPLLSDVSPPLYIVAGSRPVVAPSANVLSVAVAGESLLSSLMVVCDGVNNGVGDTHSLLNRSDVPSSGAVGSRDSDNDATPVSAESSGKTSCESSQPDEQLTSSDTNQTELPADVTAVSHNSPSAGVEPNGSMSHSPVTTPVTAASSAFDSHQGCTDVDVSIAEPSDLADSNNEIVAQSAASASGPESESLSASAEMPELTDTACHPVTRSNELVPSTSPTTSVIGCADVSTGNSLTSSAENTKQPRQPGQKRKHTPQLTGESVSRAKIGRLDSEKRLSMYICPPPDSASDKDSEIIHVMDQLCDRSVEQYLCPVDNHVSYCTASSQHLANGLLQTSCEDHVSMANTHLAMSGHCYNSSGLTTCSLSSGVQPSKSLHENLQPRSHFSMFPSAKDRCGNPSQISHVHLHENSSRVDTVPSSHNKGFAVANVLSTATAPSIPVSSSLLDTTVMSKNGQVEKYSSSVVMETPNHNFLPLNKISTIPCDSSSSILPDDLSLTDNDFAMILSDTDDGSLFSFPSRKSVDNGYWSFGSVCSRFRDRAKDGSCVEPNTEELYHSFVPMFRDQSFIPETDYVMSDHVDLGSRVCFSVSSLTSKTTSVGHNSSSPQTVNSLSSTTLIQPSGIIPHSYSLFPMQPNEALLPVDHASSRNKLPETSHSRISDVMPSSGQSSARGIFSLAHHAVQPVSKSFVPKPNSSSSAVAHSTSVLWSPCNGTSRKSSLSSNTLSAEHRQSLNIAHQCRLPSSAIGDVHWRMPEPSSFAPLYNSWSDNLHCAVQPLARPRPLVEQTVNAQPGRCNMQSVLGRSKLPETDHEKFRGRWSDDDSFCPFSSSKSKPTSSKHVGLNCQYVSQQKTVSSNSSQPLWTYSECGIAPQSYLCTSRGWLPTNSSDTGPSMTFDLSLNVPATSSTCRLPPFSFATVPPVPDFLSLSFASTTGSTNSGTGTAAKVSVWPVTLTSSCIASTSAPHGTWPVTVTSSTASTTTPRGWSPIFPQHAALQSRHNVSTCSSFVPSLTAASSSRGQEARPDVTYTVPSFVHTDKESRKHPSSLNTHLPSYTLWHGTEYIPVEMCHLPSVSVGNPDAQLLPIHGRGLYSNSEAGFIANNLTSPPLHHHPMYSGQHSGDKQVMFEPPFSLPRLPHHITSQVLNFSASFEMVPPSGGAVSSETYCDAPFNVSALPSHATVTEKDIHRSQNVSQSVSRPANVKRPSKYPKQLKHNATSLCVGYPASQTGAYCQAVTGDVPTYLPAGPFVGSSLRQKSHSSEYQVDVPFGTVFGSCSLRHGLSSDIPKSLTATGDLQTAASLPNQRHNFDIGAFISDLSSSSVQPVTVPAAIRRLDFPTPPVHVLQQQVSSSNQCQMQMECNQLISSASDLASHNFGLHSMSINSLLADNPYPGLTPRYEVYSDAINHTASSLPTYDVPTLNFSIRSQTSAVNFERTKVRHS